MQAGMMWSIAEQLEYEYGHEAADDMADTQMTLPEQLDGDTAETQVPTLSGLVADRGSHNHARARRHGPALWWSSQELRLARTAKNLDDQDAGEAAPGLRLESFLGSLDHFFQDPLLEGVGSEPFEL